jgi:hypothetical protein
VFISRPTYGSDLGAHIAITMVSICAGRREIAEFCAGTSLVAALPQQHFTGRHTPVDDLSWWKPFLQLRGPDRVAGPEEARRLFNRARQTPAERTICIDHAEDDVSLAPITATSRRSHAAMPNDGRDPVMGDVPEAYVIAERVTAPHEFRFFPPRTRRPTVVDC